VGVEEMSTRELLEEGHAFYYSIYSVFKLVSRVFW
jgi:hypothetical protein